MYVTLETQLGRLLKTQRLIRLCTQGPKLKPEQKESLTIVLSLKRINKIQKFKCLLFHDLQNMSLSSGFDKVSQNTGFKPKLGASINNLVVQAPALSLRHAKGICVCARGERWRERNLLSNRLKSNLIKLVLTAQLKVGWTNLIVPEHVLHVQSNLTITLTIITN